VHIGAVRWAAVGDALARILEATGAAVTREYYFNDAGAQIDRFARSLLAAAQGRPGPDDGYTGAYISDIAQSVLARRPGVLDLPDAEAQEVFRVEGVDLMFEEIRSSLAGFGVVFDVYFNEKDLHDSGELDEALQRLREADRVYEQDGATWLRTTDFGDDKDRVLVKADGEWTYFAADAAYYYDKRKRGFDRVVIMLGADHHGYIGRYKALVASYGDDPEKNLEILIGQLVNLVKDGFPVRMSKRAGNVLTLADLVDAVGADAARYALARSSADSPIDLDLDLLVKHSNDNPVYYVQYAHARTCNVTKNATEVGIGLDVFDPGLLTHDTEALLLGMLGEFPAVVATAAELREPHRVARYLEQLAGTYHRWYDSCRVIPRATSRSPTSTAPGPGSTQPPARCWPTACGCSGSTHRSECEPARAPRWCAARRGSGPRPGLAAPPAGRQRAGAGAVGAQTSSAATQVRSPRRASTCVSLRRSTAPGVHRGRGRLPRPRPHVPRRLRRCRHLLRGQGVPVPGGGPLAGGGRRRARRQHGRELAYALRGGFPSSTSSITATTSRSPSWTAR
jgi:hypothetical protein